MHSELLGLERLCRRFIYLYLSLGVVDSRVEMCYVTSVEYTVSCCNVVNLSRKVSVKLGFPLGFPRSRAPYVRCKKRHRIKRKHLHNGNSAALTSAALYAKFLECLFLGEVRSSAEPRMTKATGANSPATSRNAAMDCSLCARFQNVRSWS